MDFGELVGDIAIGFFVLILLAVLGLQLLELMEKLEDIYLNLSKDLLGALRRRLPVTKQKFDWERAGTGGVAKLGKNLQEMAAK